MHNASTCRSEISSEAVFHADHSFLPSSAPSTLQSGGSRMFDPARVRLPAVRDRSVNSRLPSGYQPAAIWELRAMGLLGLAAWVTVGIGVGRMWLR